MVYLLQLLNATHFQKTLEVESASIEGLQVEAARMVRNNPEVKGMTYRIFKIPVKANGVWDTLNSTMIKEAAIAA